MCNYKELYAILNSSNLKKQFFLFEFDQCGFKTMEDTLEKTSTKIMYYHHCFIIFCCSYKKVLLKSHIFAQFNSCQRSAAAVSQLPQRVDPLKLINDTYIRVKKRKNKYKQYLFI